MNLVDYVGAFSALLGGTMVFCHAYLSGFKERGFPGEPWPIRGAMLFLGLFLWLRACLVAAAAHVVSERYPHGHHVTPTEMCIYGALGVWLTMKLMHYFFSAHRWYAEGKDLMVADSDKPTVKNVPDQIRETLREEVPREMARANTALLDGLGGPVKPHGEK